MANIPLTLSLGALTTGANLTPQQFAQAIVDRITATVDGGNIFFGQMGGSEPMSPLAGQGGTYGLWLNGGVIYAWDVTAAKYLPAPLVLGQLISGSIVTTTLQSGALTNHTLTTPDKDGTIATTDDIVTISGTQGLTGTSITIDWSIKKQVYIVLTGNTTITNTNMLDSQQQDIFIENNQTGYTATFSGVYWPAGFPSGPTITATSAGSAIRKIDHFRLQRIGDATTGSTLGEVVHQNYSISTVGGSSGGDVTPPTVTSITGSKFKIDITMSELLQGSTLNASGFTVIKNGSPDTVVSASASGTVITLQLGTSFGGNATVTVQYTGSDIKDLAGNPASVFGPSTVTYATTSL
jgi:hypothetical protein